MVILIAMGTAVATCTWTIQQEELPSRTLLMPNSSRAFARLAPSAGSAVAEVLYTPGVARMNVQIHDKHLEIEGEMEVEEFTYIGSPLAWGMHGTIQRGATVHLLEMDGDSVVIVPKSIANGDVEVREEVRVLVGCELLAVSIPNQPIEPTEPATDGVLLHAAGGLRATIAGESTLKLTGTRHQPLAFTRIGVSGRSALYAYSDAWGTVWMGWESASGFDAPEQYWREGLMPLTSLGVGSGQRRLYRSPLVCEEPVALSVEGVVVGRLLPGGRIVSVGTHNVVPLTDWLLPHGRWTASTMEGCALAD
ncbi:MAG: hypothetical protein ACI8RZ_005655 [Myxococcota bacterium]|jgi:hypothetical protein